MVVIDYSNVDEIIKTSNCSFYIDVLNNSICKGLYKLNKEIDLYFFEEYKMKRNELKNNEYFTNELDKIISYINELNTTLGKKGSTKQLIHEKNEIVAMLDCDAISFINLIRIQRKIIKMNSNDKNRNHEQLKKVKTEILSQFPKIEHTIKVVKHYKIINGAAIIVPMDDYISLKRPIHDNNIYLCKSNEKIRSVYVNYKLGPRAGEGFELTFTRINNKWVIKNSKSTWLI